MKLDEFVLENWLNPAANSPKNKSISGRKLRSSHDSRRAL